MKRQDPRPLLELNLQQAVAGVLQKPRWWTKWRDDELRLKWLREIEQQFLLQTFDQTLMGWTRGQQPLDDLGKLLQEPPEQTERSAKLAGWLNNISTDLNFETDSDEEEEEPSDDSGDASSGQSVTAGTSGGDARGAKAKTKQDALKSKLSSRESYASIKWTVNQLLLHEKLSAIPFELWTEDNLKPATDAARSLDDPTLNSRATEFVLAVRQGASVKTALPLPADSEGISQMRLEVLQMHCERIHHELAAVKACIVRTIEAIAAGEQFDPTGHADEMIISPAGIDGVWISDNAVSDTVASLFASEVHELENVPDEQKDWHPKSDKKVLDLVHPSLYCCVFGQTLRVSGAPDPNLASSPAEQMNRMMFAGVDEVEKPVSCNTDYQWIPSDFLVGKKDANGRHAVRILSYINNLHPEKHGELYDSIASIFGSFVPLFETLLSVRDAWVRDPLVEVDMYHHEAYDELPQRPAVPAVLEVPKIQASASWEGKKLQVIVKVAEIVLTPENPRYAGGSWHIEGTPAEKIISTGIYYFACENIKDSRLSFRMEVMEPMYQQSDDDGVAAVYGMFNEQLLAQVLGSVNTTEGRCVVFPNVLQHQVQPFELADPSRPGVRKILAFFLVDPDTPVPSTLVIPPQQQEWIDMAQVQSLSKLSLLDNVEENIKSMLPRGMSLEEAKAHRLGLMEERAAPNDEDDGYDYDERFFSLCEH